MKTILLILLSTVSMLNLFGQSTQINKKDSAKIFPVIKVSQSTDDATFAFKKNEKPVSKKIAGDLYCYYGIDKGTHSSLILEKQLSAEINLEKLDEIARENLIKDYRKKIEMHFTDFGGIGLTCGGDYEASLITVNGVLDIMVEELGDNLIFAVPSKDLLVFVNGDDQKAIDGLKQMIDEVHRDGEQLLSKLLFTYKDKKIEVVEK